MECSDDENDYGREVGFWRSIRGVGSIKIDSRKTNLTQ